MKRDILYATGFFEIGDTFYDEEGHLRTVTDVLVCHYIRRGTYKILYEVDSCGQFQEVLLRGFGDLPQNQKANDQPDPIMPFTPKIKPQSGGE